MLTFRLPFNREWTWTAQVFLTLHTLVLLMKMHSYAFYNGHLSETERRLKALDEPSTASKAPAYQYPSAGHTPTSEARDKNDADELSRLREDLAIELTSPMGAVTYPKNLTWANYTDYIFCPTLCYELEYPRTPGIVWTELGYKILWSYLPPNDHLRGIHPSRDDRIRLSTGNSNLILGNGAHPSRINIHAPISIHDHLPPSLPRNLRVRAWSLRGNNL